MKSLTVLLFLALCGCPDVPVPQVDQCLRRQYFNECLAALPKGPTTVVNNDWDEVVSECNNAAYYMALRSAKVIGEECRSQ